jgi:hypothetical protein
LNEKLIQIVNETRKKIEDYNSIENPDIKDDKMEELISIITIGEFNSDIGRIIEILDEEISNLKDSLDKARNIKTEKYFNHIINNNYHKSGNFAHLEDNTGQKKQRGHNSLINKNF